MAKGHTRYKLVRRDARGKVTISGIPNSLNWSVIFRVTHNLQIRLLAAGRGLETRALNCHPCFLYLRVEQKKITCTEIINI
jgi:hypothetical protein